MRAREFDPNDPEMMDRPQPVSRALEDDLTSLEWLNACFGAHRFLREFLGKNFAGERSLRVLDLATGGGDLPRVAVAWGRKLGVEVTVDALDFHPATLEIAAKRSEEMPEIRFHRHDIREPWGGGGYDLVMSFLALHHFSEEDGVIILREMRRHEGAVLLACDLERTRLAAAGIWLLTQFVLTAPMTRHDARVSIRRAFSLGEFRQLAVAAEWGSFVHRRVFPARQAVWMSARGAPRPV